LLTSAASYCAPIASIPATLTWAEFNTKCYDTPPDGASVTGAPAVSGVEVLVLPSNTAGESFDFCVEQLTLTTL
jgi:hypothetical protein